MSLPFQHTDRLNAATAPLVLRVVTEHPLLPLMTPGTIEALEAIVSCERDLTAAEIGFLREMVEFLDLAEIAASRKVWP